MTRQEPAPTDSSLTPEGSQTATRRGFLHLAGGAIVAVAAGGAVIGDVFASGRGVFATGTGDAYAAWDTWQRGAPPLRLVRAAILAVNAHNSQPWQFSVSSRRIDVFDDRSRSLGTIDPYRREMHLSLGAAVENLALAARAAGLTPDVAVGPIGGDETHLAAVELRSGTPDVSELYRAIPRRHTDRAAYVKDRRLPAEVASSMQALVDRQHVRIVWLLTPGQMTEFADLTVAATEAFVADTQQSADDYAWYRGTWSELQKHKDGVTVDAAGLPPLLRSIGKLTPASREQNGEYWLSGTKDRQLPTAAAFGIVVVRDAASPAQRVEAGRIYQRLHLWATAHDLAMQPLNQSVERAEREQSTTGPGEMSRGLARLVGDAGWQPVMPFRIGYPTAAALASPRRPVEDVMRP
jgi:hypothetical protein